MCPFLVEEGLDIIILCSCIASFNAANLCQHFDLGFPILPQKPHVSVDFFFILVLKDNSLDLDGGGEDFVFCIGLEGVSPA